MVVVEDREEVIRRIAKCGIVVGAERALVDPPAVVAALHDRRVHFLARALSHVADPLLAGGAVETEPPRVAQAECINLVPTGQIDEGVVRGGRVGRTCDGVRFVDVDAEDFSEQHIGVLRIVWWVVGATTVPHADV